MKHRHEDHPTSIDRRTFVGASMAAVAGLLAPQAMAQQAFPSGPIKLILHTPPGGGNDAMARLFSLKMQESWGQPVVVENRTGGNGSIATQALIKSPADGHTMMVNMSALLSQLVVTERPGYKLSDLVPVSWICDIPIAIGVRSGLGVDSLKDLIALAKSSPGKLSYATAGPASSPNFVGELLKAETGTSIVHIPYRGDAPAVLDTVAGQVDIVLGALGTMSQYPDKIKVLATAGSGRFPTYPKVPTLTELGYPAVDMPGWAGLFAPVGTPPAVVQRWAAEIERLVKLPDVSRRMLEFGFLPVGQGPERFAAMMKDHLARFERVVAQGRIKVG
ncbi:Bug family tripartite tricarboxylate transporter substrate binding protein [Hydrogenophaga sp. BPS33]|uniref:Bug family tripartite tricarboxylate transporter substrate binding protein n=1 Tax=Hydrogenophaga sp. BPS33 TaxID=2651974 RepID=UPI00131FB8FC|nr:tripartite tricarboxylate transporter substrate binding protein [Hydrogenophaga sp. BPS33]QHE85511.1 tripartite tricarboxylate transporter substrate binding protein [Hydrogenophaga sp. BPS33]